MLKFIIEALFRTGDLLLSPYADLRFHSWEPINQCCFFVFEQTFITFFIVVIKSKHGYWNGIGRGNIVCSLKPMWGLWHQKLCWALAGRFIEQCFTALSISPRIFETSYDWLFFVIALVLFCCVVWLLWRYGCKWAEYLFKLGFEKINDLQYVFKLGSKTFN